MTPSVDDYTSSTAVRRSPFPSRGRQEFGRADDIRPYGKVWGREIIHWADLELMRRLGEREGTVTP